MELTALALEGAKYILKSFAETKAYTSLRDATAGRFVDWVKHLFLKSDKNPELVLNADIPEDKKQILLAGELQNLLKDEDVRKEFEGWIIKVKNEFTGEIGEINGNVFVGDIRKAGIAPKEANYDKKNIFSGKIGKVGGNFRLGDDEK